MTANDSFERDLERWLEADAPMAAPGGLHDAFIDRARGSRQRPQWMVAVRGGTLGESVETRHRPGVRVGFVLLVLGVVLAIVAAIAVGAFRADQRKLVRNGAVAYSVQDLLQRTRPFIVHSIDPDGTDQAIAFGNCPTFSKDGTALAYLTGTHSAAELNLARPDGTRSQIVLAIGESEYALSPDGTRIAWFKQLPPADAPLRTELWVTPVSGGPGNPVVPASENPTEWYGFPVWSPDGRQIVFVSNDRVSSADNARDYRPAIYIVDVDGSNLRRLTARSGTPEIGLSWSPDGRYLAYLGVPDGSPLPPPDDQPADVFVINADGTGDRNLTNSEAAERDVAWSPDGTHLAYYQVGKDGVGHLTTVRMDGPTAAGPPIVGPDSGVSWSPDGTKLLIGGIQSVDAEFRQPPTTLHVVTGGLTCAPSWQRLEP